MGTPCVPILLHVHPSHTFYALLNGIRFLVITEVYGGPVGASVVEELAFYGIKNVIGLGFVGCLDASLKLGDLVLVDKAPTEPGTTPAYSTEEHLYPNEFMERYFTNQVEKVTCWTTNALYREYPEDVQKALLQGCQVVNMDASHLYASCVKLGIKCVYLATVR